MKRLLAFGLVGLLVVGAFFVMPFSPLVRDAQAQTLGTALYSEPIVLTNSQGTATGANTNVRIVMNSSLLAAYLNSNLTNFEVFYAANSSVVPTWIETNASNASSTTNLWVNVVSIGAHSSLRLMLGIFAKTSFLLTATAAGTGESPTLSATYGQFDNGRYVFPMYDNFAGSTLNSYLWASSFASGAATVNNGLSTTSVQTGSATQAACGLIAKHQNVTGGYFLAVQVAAAGFGDTSRFGPMSTTASGAECGTANTVLVNFDASHSGSTTQYFIFHQTSAGSFSTDTVSWTYKTTAAYLLQQEQDPTQANTSINYTQNKGGAFSNYNPVGGSFPGIYLKSNTGTTGNVVWVRERTTYPNSVAPNVAFGPQVTPRVTAVGATNSPTTFAVTAVGGTGTYTNYTWRFGDGATGYGSAPSHAYNGLGPWTAMVAVTDASGAVSFGNVTFSVPVSGGSVIVESIFAGLIILPFIGAILFLLAAGKGGGGRTYGGMRSRKYGAQG